MNTDSVPAVGIEVKGAHLGPVVPETLGTVYQQFFFFLGIKLHQFGSLVEDIRGVALDETRALLGYDRLVHL